jgi:hypothetical protein
VALKIKSALKKKLETEIQKRISKKGTDVLQGSNSIKKSRDNTSGDLKNMSIIEELRNETVKSITSLQ